MNIRKMTITALLVAVAVVASPMSIPIGTAKVFPVQHFVNVVTAVLLGPLYAVMQAFLTSLLRNLMGTGTLLAFPGSMAGALLAGILHRAFNRKGTLNYIPAVIGEVFGTGILGALLAYPVARFMLGKAVNTFTFVIPFLLSTAAGAVIAFIMLRGLAATGIMETVHNKLR